MILADAPIKISGFSLNEIDQIVIGDEADAIENGPLAPDPGAVPVARLGDIFRLAPHRIICGDARDPMVFRLLMRGDPAALSVATKAVVPASPFSRRAAFGSCGSSGPAAYSASGRVRRRRS